MIKTISYSISRLTGTWLIIWLMNKMNPGYFTNRLYLIAGIGSVVILIWTWRDEGDKK